MVLRYTFFTAGVGYALYAPYKGILGGAFVSFSLFVSITEPICLAVRYLFNLTLT